MDKDIYLRKDIYDAEQDTLLVLLQDTNKRIDDLQNSISHWFSIIGTLFVVIQIGFALLFYFLK